jgi:hypothetical protein
MCGIVGFITAETSIGENERRKWFINALRAGVVRGEDGTGMFMVKHKHEGSADWAKQGASAEYFLDSPQATERLRPTVDFGQYRAVIGHNRSATVGNVSTENSHPFTEGPITLVHNGTLSNTHGLPNKSEKSKKATVDSHVICHNLATHTPDEVIKELTGAYALVWHDARDNSVNIIRNTERPLHILPLKYHKTLLIASEAEMLWWLAKRSSFSHSDKMYYPVAGHLLTFTEDKGIEPTTRKIETKGWSYGSGRRSSWSYDDADYYVDPRWRDSRPPGVAPKGEGPNMGKAGLSGPVIQQAALYRAIPKPLSKTLGQVGLDVLDKLRMNVVAVQPVHGTKGAVVVGRLIDLPNLQTAHVYGMDYEAVLEAVGHETWTVAPNGVRVTEGGRKVIVARLLARTATTSEATPPYSQLSLESQSGSTDAEDVECDDNEGRDYGPVSFTDPDGNFITLLDWCILAQGGCSVCGTEIGPEDADDIAWDVTTKLPICPDCVCEILEDEDEADKKVIDDRFALQSAGEA